MHYPLPLHRQPAFRGFPLAGDRLPVAERIAAEVVSLPMHGYLTRALQDRIIDRVRSYAAPDPEGTCAARAAALSVEWGAKAECERVR